MGSGLNSLQYGVLYLGSHYNTGPYTNFPHFGNSNLGKLPHECGSSGSISRVVGVGVGRDQSLLTFAYKGSIGVIMGIMEKKMETTIMG